jgi:hypothetical protein
MEILEENDKYIHVKYENCKIYMNFRDFLGIRKVYPHFQFDDSKIIYLNSFECDITNVKKGNGRILLSLLLEYINNTRFKSDNIFVSLIVSGQKRIDETGIEIQSDDAKLIHYYTKLGFKIIGKDNDIMIGRLQDILRKCKSYIGGKPSRKKRPVTNKKKRSNNNKKYAYYF